MAPARVSDVGRRRQPLSTARPSLESNDNCGESLDPHFTCHLHPLVLDLIFIFFQENKHTRHYAGSKIIITHLTLITMGLKFLGAKAAAALDKELMSSGAFSIDQLMELAGLSVSQAVYRVQPPSSGRRVLVACGPGNNGMSISFLIAMLLSHICFPADVESRW